MNKILLLAGTHLAQMGPARAHGDMNFDATSVAPDQGVGDVLPTGWYNVQMDESEKVPTKDGGGSYWKFRFHVLDGQYAGRKVYAQVTSTNPNQQAVEIGQKQLSAICHAVGVLRPGKSEELHGKPLKIKLSVKKDGEYGDQNKIQSYKPSSEQVDMAGGDSGAAAFGAGAPAGAAGAPASPWAAAPAAAAAESAPPAATQSAPWAEVEKGLGAKDAAPPPPPAAEPAPPPPAAHDPMEAAKADGWIQHPSSPPHMYKGQDVKTHADVAALYPAPPVPDVPPPPPAAGQPPAPAAATTASPSDAATAPPPWAKPAA